MQKKKTDALVRTVSKPMRCSAAVTDSKLSAAVPDGEMSVTGSGSKLPVIVPVNNAKGVEPDDIYLPYVSDGSVSLTS